MDEYETSKKELRSLLITFKDGCSLFEFKKQYQMMMGQELPFMRYGFKNEIEFLYSMPDVVQMTPAGRDYFLKVVADQTTKHILKLVSKQKSVKPKTSRRFFAVPPRQFVAPPPGFPRYASATPCGKKANMMRNLPQSMIDEITYLIQKYHNGLSLQDILRRYRSCYGKEFIFTTYGFFTLEECLRTISQLKLRRIGNDICVFCSSQEENANPVPEEKIIISKSLYHKPFEPSKENNEAPFNKIGIQNRQDADKLGMVHFTTKENVGPFKRKMDCLDDFGLKLGSRSPVSENFQNNPIKDLPPKAFSPMNQYTQQRLPTRLVLGSIFQAYVSNILNPEHIYIQLGDEEQALSDMNHALEKFYTESESRSFVMKDVYIKAGSVGVAQWPTDMHWYRIKVMSILSDFVKVFFVDYGTVDTISKTLLRYVREDFTSLPAQAVRASLAYVKRPKGFSTWSQRATDRILALSLDESVKAKVEDIENDVLSLLLYNKNDIYINGALVDEHLAQSTSVYGSHPKLVDLSGKASSASHYSAHEQSPSLSASTAETRLTLPSTSQSFQNPNDKSSVCMNFAKPFETASASGPSSYLKPQMTEKYVVAPQTSCMPKEGFINVSSSSSSSDNEIFDDDADAFFEEFYQKVSLVTKRYVKRIRTSDGYMFHILIHKSKPYVSCGDISHLIWTNKDFEFMLQRLQNYKSQLVEELIWEDENLIMFEQLRRFKIKGLKVLNERTCFLIFSLNNVIDILNKFGHPSVELRTKIIHEYSSFDPDHPIWKELSEVEFTDVEEEFLDRTDDEKLNRLCLYDLQVMKGNIHIRYQRLQLQKSPNPESVYQEEQKLYFLNQKVMKRIVEVQQICGNFSTA